MDSLPPLYSIRMRAAAGGAHEHGGHHLAGGERLVPEAELESTLLDLFRRARRAGLDPDFIRLTVERVSPADVTAIPCLPVTTVTAPDAPTALSTSFQLLLKAGVSFPAIAAAFQALTEGFGPDGRVLRGAALFDSETAARRDPDFYRGVRATRLDFAPDAREAIRAELAAHGLTHPRTLDALAVASKVRWAGVLAELCWSDDPDYVAGYVTTPEFGYVRFPHFKPTGALGGRVFFVSPNADIAQLTERLEQACALITAPVTVHHPVPPDALWKQQS